VHNRIELVDLDMDTRPKTVICDIDGTLVVHENPSLLTDENFHLTLIPGTIEKMKEWDLKGYRIILLTGRRESARKATEAQLSQLGIFYDHLIMGVGGGDRIIINDRKTDGRITCFSFSPKRDEGIGSIDF